MWRYRGHRIKNRFLTCPYVSFSFSDETPTRFQKELLKAAKADTNGNVPLDRVNKILRNIGKPEEQLSKQEMSLLQREAGVRRSSSFSIPASAMMQFAQGY